MSDLGDKLKEKLDASSDDPVALLKRAKELFGSAHGSEEWKAISSNKELLEVSFDVIAAVATGIFMATKHDSPKLAELTAHMAVDLIKAAMAPGYREGKLAAKLEWTNNQEE